MIIILEGTDRIGKSTFARNIKKNYKKIKKIEQYEKVEIIKFGLTPYLEKLREKYPEKQMNELTAYDIEKALTQTLNKVIKKYNKNVLYIFDRSFYGEYVYGELYRKDSLYLECIDRLERKLFEVDNDITMIFCTFHKNQFEKIVGMEDGNSASVSKEQKEEEIRIFKNMQGYIKNKNIKTTEIEILTENGYKKIETLIQEINEKI